MILSKDQAMELAVRSFENPAFFARVFLPQWFSLPMPWFHRGVLAILSRQTDWLLEFGEEEWARGTGIWDQSQLEKILHHFVWKQEPDDPLCKTVPVFLPSVDNKGRIASIDLGVSDKTLLIAPRGVSKTTLLNAHHLREIARHEASFMVYVSESGSHAEMQLQNIKRQIETNELYISVFGQKRPDRTDPEKWQAKLIQTTDGITVSAKGRGAQIRGANDDARRPSDIILDDVEDKESVKTEDQRRKTLDWFTGDVEQALPQINVERRRLTCIGTILSKDALLPTLAKNPDFLTIQFGAKDPDGDMLWSHYLTQEEYDKKKKVFMRRGQLHLFKMEYDSTTRTDGEDNPFFKQSYLKYAQYDPETFPGLAIMLDPAISEDRRACYSSFIVGGMSPKGKIHIFDCYMQKGMTPRELIDKYFELHFKWGCVRHGIETIGFQKALVHIMQEEMFRKAKSMGSKAYFEIEPIGHHSRSKGERIEGILSPRYASGYITHERSFPDLELQLLNYPNEALDGPDAEAMMVQLLDPYAAFAFDPEDEDPNKLEKNHFQPADVEYKEFWSAP